MSLYSSSARSASLNSRGIILIGTAESTTALHPLLSSLHLFAEVVHVKPPNKDARRDVSSFMSGCSEPSKYFSIPDPGQDRTRTTGNCTGYTSRLRIAIELYRSGHNDGRIFCYRFTRSCSESSASSGHSIFEKHRTGGFISSSLTLCHHESRSEKSFSFS